MSTPTNTETPASLVKRFVERTYEMSRRQAGPLAGVSHTKAGEWKDWYDEGADPETLPEPKPATLDGVRHYLRMADDLEYRKAAFKVAADRLEVVAEDLRKEAETMSPPTAPPATPSGADVSDLDEGEQVFGEAPPPGDPKPAEDEEDAG